MARCECGGGQCNCALVAGPGVTIDGTGSTANPHVISAEAVDCDQVRPCFSAGDGIAYDEATGEFSADLSGDAGNNIATGTDGGLFVPTGAATVSVGCGLTGDGSASSPVTAATGTWPYSCDVDTAGDYVYCDAAGALRTAPPKQVTYFTHSEQRDYADLTVPSGFDQPGDTFALEVTNPDACREALVYIEQEADVDFVLPAGGGGAAYGHGTDEMVYLENNGSELTSDTHVQTTKAYALSSNLAPAETRTVHFDVMLGRGKGGATYNRIQVALRALVLSI